LISLFSLELEQAMEGKKKRKKKERHLPLRGKIMEMVGVRKLGPRNRAKSSFTILLVGHHHCRTNCILTFPLVSESNDDRELDPGE
jgi:hypothetical protein